MRRRRQGEGGFATVEFALTLPAIMAVLLLVMAVAAAGLAQLRAGDAARAAARELAVGGDASRAAVVVEQVAGASAHLTVTHDGGLVRAVVEVPVVAGWGSWEVRGEAAAIPEG